MGHSECSFLTLVFLSIDVVCFCLLFSYAELVACEMIRRWHWFVWCSASSTFRTRTAFSLDYHGSCCWPKTRFEKASIMITRRKWFITRCHTHEYSTSVLSWSIVRPSKPICFLGLERSFWVHLARMGAGLREVRAVVRRVGGGGKGGSMHFCTAPA